MTEDIHQDRFALMAALTRAHEARPADYTDSETLMSMSDERLLAHATEVLSALEQASGDDEATAEVRAALRRILGESAGPG